MSEKKTLSTLQFALQSNEEKKQCYWCGERLTECNICHGSGVYKNHICYPCGNTGLLCPMHGKEWELISGLKWA